jgi:hypothetical protein
VGARGNNPVCRQLTLGMSPTSTTLCWGRHRFVVTDAQKRGGDGGGVQLPVVRVVGSTNEGGLSVGVRRFLLIMTVVFLSVSATPVAPARAAGGTQCTFETDVVASPGLTTSSSSGTVNSDKDGTFACDGPVNGKQPTGAGTSNFAGRYGTKDPDSCQSGGEGDGVFTLTIPTSSGTEHIKNTETYAYGAFKAGAPFSGTFQGDRMSGTFEAQPIDGDCASKPVTKFHVKGKGTLT